MGKLTSVALWGLIALAGAFSFAALALNRGESVNAVWLVTAALAVYFIAYRFYSKFIAEKVLQLDDRRQTPAERSLEEGLLPLGLAHNVKLKRDVATGEALRWADVDCDPNDAAVKIRREMEAAFARPNV